jgi:hypothetical protein
MDIWKKLRPLATRLGVTDEAFKKWRQRGVPHKHFFELLRVAKKEGVTLKEAELRAVASGELSTTNLRRAG